MSHPLCKLLEQTACLLESRARGYLIRPMPALGPGLRVFDQLVKRLGDRLPREPRRSNPASHAKPVKPRGVVRLIEPHRHRQLRNASRKTLGERPDAPVVDERGAPREYLRKRNEGLVVDKGRQRRKLARVSREQQRPSSEARACVDGGLEERRGLLVRRAWREDDRRRASVHEARRFHRDLRVV